MPDSVVSMRTYAVDTDGRISKCDEPTGDDGAFAWADLSVTSRDDTRSALGTFDVPRRLIAYSTGDERFARVVSIDDMMLVRIPAFVNPDRHDPAQVQFLVSATRLITVRETTIPAIDAVLKTGQLDVREPTPVAALYAVLDRMSDRIIHFFMESRSAADELAHQLDEGSRIPIQTIIQLRHKIGHLAIACEDQLYCLKAIETSQTGQSLTDRQRTMFQDLVELLNHAHKGILRLEGVVRDLHQTHLGRLQDNSNRRLRDLTIISALFMPPTLLAGVYGMNFRSMPELAAPYGYPTVLVSMFMVACGMLAFFRRRGWFDE